MELVSRLVGLDSICKIKRAERTRPELARYHHCRRASISKEDAESSGVCICRRSELSSFLSIGSGRNRTEGNDREDKGGVDVLP